MHASEILADPQLRRFAEPLGDTLLAVYHQRVFQGGIVVHQEPVGLDGKSQANAEDMKVLRYAQYQQQMKKDSAELHALRRHYDILVGNDETHSLADAENEVEFIRRSPHWHNELRTRYRHLAVAVLRNGECFFAVSSCDQHDLYRRKIGYRSSVSHALQRAKECLDADLHGHFTINLTAETDHNDILQMVRGELDNRGLLIEGLSKQHHFDDDGMTLRSTRPTARELMRC